MSWNPSFCISVGHRSKFLELCKIRLFYLLSFLIFWNKSLWSYVSHLFSRVTKILPINCNHFLCGMVSKTAFLIIQPVCNDLWMSFIWPSVSYQAFLWKLYFLRPNLRDWSVDINNHIILWFFDLAKTKTLLSLFPHALSDLVMIIFVLTWINEHSLNIVLQQVADGHLYILIVTLLQYCSDFSSVISFQRKK